MAEKEKAKVLSELYIEAADRTHVIQGLVDFSLEGHPVIAASGGQHLLDRVTKDLGLLYQLLAARAYETEKEPK